MTGRTLSGKLSCTWTGLVPLPLIQKGQLSVTGKCIGTQYCVNKCTGRAIALSLALVMALCDVSKEVF